jgi:uncharacterized membrane protein (DUF4010 family)
MPNQALLVRLIVALGIGLLIGAERERRKRMGPLRGAAGVRTFTVASLLGALSLVVGGSLLLAVAMAGITALAVLAYLRTRDKDPGVTTESALLLTVLLGGLAVREPALASAVAVVVAILLAARVRLHRFVRSVMSEQELHDALIFAAAVIVVLPLMPNRYLGPFGAINPRVIWKIAVLMMAVSALGHIATRALGSKYGLPLAGLASGFASSTATVASMAAKVKQEPALARPATAGAVLATIGSIVELVIVIEATNRVVFGEMKWPMLAAIVAAVLYGVAFTIRTMKYEARAAQTPGSVFDLKVTLVLVATITAALLISAALHASAGRTGVAIGAAVAGFADAHSAAVSVASLVTSGKMTAREAVVPIFAGLTTNTLTKAVIAFTIGGRRFAATVVPGLTVVVVVLWLTSLV